MLLGCIADDLTGATDLSLMFVRGGMHTVQVIGLPEKGQSLPDADVVVIALKSRSNSPEEAVSWSLAACDALVEAGAKQIFFKYCSTFDSTPKGNIGPVTDALIDRLGACLTIACPAFPETGRSIYQGNLFVNGVPLNESPLKDHPLNPMMDSNLVRVLSEQTKYPVGLVPYEVVDAGPAAIEQEFQSSVEKILIVDSITNEHLFSIGRACRDLKLITGGSGIAMGLPDNFRNAGLLKKQDMSVIFETPSGPAVILAGSCSAATLGQIEHAKLSGFPTRQIDALEIANGLETVEAIVTWVSENSGKKAPLIYSSGPPEQIAEVQKKLGREEASALVEETFAEVAAELSKAGLGQLIVAGGETSGAVVSALGINLLEIGPEIDPGVPWTRALDGVDLALALKSGNFGAEDFFEKALEMLA